MKLSDVYSKSMREILEECNIVDQKFYTDDDGNVQAIEMKYKPKEIKPETPKNTGGRW